MPQIGKKKFPYTPEGMRDAEKEKRRQSLAKKSKDKKK